MRVIQKALTFDDVLLVPAHSRVLPREASLKTRLTRKLQLNLPLVSAAMDTVTEARLAIAIAQEGGIGIVHKNLPPKAQAAEVAKVKRFESGVLRDPVTIPPEMPVREVIALQRERKISGFPVVKNGKVVGIVTNRDLRFETKLDQPVKAIMTPREKLITVREGASRQEAKQLMHRHRLERVLVVGRGLPAEGPGHGAGHPQGERAPERLQGRAGQAARRRRGRRGRGHRGARRGAGGGGRRRAGRRHRAWPRAGRARPRRLDQEELQDRSHRRQHRHRRRRKSAGRPRRRRRQGRHRPGIDLHHAHRRRRRRAADHRDPGRGRRPQGRAA